MENQMAVLVGQMTGLVVMAMVLGVAVGVWAALRVSDAIANRVVRGR